MYRHAIRRATRAKHVRHASVSAAPKPTSSILQGIFNQTSTPEVSMDLPYPDVKVEASTTAPSLGEVETTTTPSGLRVITRNADSPVSSVGVFFDAGSRYETAENNGISHFLSAMAYKSTRHRPDFEIVGELSKQGGSVTSSAARESILFTGEILRPNVNFLVETLGEVTQRNSYNAIESKEMANFLNTQRADSDKSAEYRVIEGLHNAAYGNIGLGLRLDGPANAYSKLTGNLDAVRTFRDAFLRLDNCVISAVGVDHGDFVAQVQKYFIDPRSETDAVNMTKESAAKYLNNNKTVYSGGAYKLELPDEDLFHYALGYEGASWNHADLVPMCVLQMLMGGGGSFSAGGPGKGMCSRLYENVLNRHGFVHNATSFGSIYSDSAVFGISAQAPAEFARELIDTVKAEAERMAGPVDPTELSRAKNQLKSGVMMQLESRVLQQEDMGRQMLTYGRVKSGEEVCKQIDAVTAKDIQRVASNMLNTKASYAAVGNLAYLPPGL